MGPEVSISSISYLTFQNITNLHWPLHWPSCQTLNADVAVVGRTTKPIFSLFLVSLSSRSTQSLCKQWLFVFLATQHCCMATSDYRISQKMTGYFRQPCLCQGQTSPVPYDANERLGRENEGFAFRCQLQRLRWPLTSIKVWFFIPSTCSCCWYM